MLSLIIPVYNEEENIENLYKRTTDALEKMDLDYEIICVNDGSHDETYRLLLEKHLINPKFKVLSLSRNFGHQAAVFAGLSHAQGEYIAIIDGDLQDPPEILADMHAKMADDWDVVYAVRKKRKENIFKKAAYLSFYRILKKMSEIEIPLDTGDFSMMRRCVVEQLLKMPEQSLFIRGLRAWVGFRQTEFVYERDSRQAGEPKFTLSKLLELAFNGIYSFSKLPVRFFKQLGGTVISLSLLYVIYIVIKKIFFGDVPEGFTTLIVFISFFSGVQLLALGIMGEYLARIYDETRQRPLFIIQQKHL